MKMFNMNMFYNIQQGLIRTNDLPILKIIFYDDCRFEIQNFLSLSEYIMDSFRFKNPIFGFEMFY